MKAWTSRGCFGLVLALSFFLTQGSSRPLLPAGAQSKAATELKTVSVHRGEGDGFEAVIEADGTMEHRIYQLDKPRQLVLDIPGVRNPLRHYYPPKPHPLVERIEMYDYTMRYSSNGAEGHLARVVFDLKKAVQYRIRAEGNQLKVELLPKTADAGPKLPVERPAAGSEETTSDPWIPSRVSIEPEDVNPKLFFGPMPPQSDDYRLGPEDVLEIRVFELDQLNRTVRVAGDGRIDLPLIGSIPVHGLTAEQVATRLADRLRNRYVQDPQVGVFVKDFKSQKISLLGAVNKPATYPLRGRCSLLQQLADAGGLASGAGVVLYVFRQSEDGRSARLTVPLNELLFNGDPRWNIWLLPGDVISVPPEKAISVSLLGAVNSPGIHKLPVGEGGTLLKAIALAGGLTDRASKKGIQIKRHNASGEETLIKVDLGDILSGKKPDIILREGDVVIVKESFF